MGFLSVHDVWKSFGGIKALQGVSFDVEEGQICGLIGPNGAGKTTLFNCLSRLYDVDLGRMTFEGKNILKYAAHQMASLGIARTFQNVALFPTMTVLENLLLGGHCQLRANPILAMVRWQAVVRRERLARERAASLIDYLGLEAVADRPAGELPFPTRKRVELGRALMCAPKVLLLDEPAAGLNQEEVTQLGTLIGRIRSDWNVTILLVEHHMALVMGLSEKVCVLDFGRKIAEGTPTSVQNDREVIRAYLGEGKGERIT